METLLWLRLHDGGKGVRSESPISWAPDLCSLRSEGDSGRWKGRLLKLLERRQAREDLHDAQQLLVLELVVLKATRETKSLSPGVGTLRSSSWQGTGMATLMGETQHRVPEGVGDLLHGIQ